MICNLQKISLNSIFLSINNLKIKFPKLTINIHNQTITRHNYQNYKLMYFFQSKIMHRGPMIKDHCPTNHNSQNA